MLRHKLLNITKQANHSSKQKMIKYTSAGLLILGTSYTLFHPNKRKSLQSKIASITRFGRSLIIGLTVSIDYWAAPLMGYTESETHQLAAHRIVQGCLQNGGIYIKLGQGLAAVNHILPKEYVNSLEVLQDKCLTRGENELQEIFLQEFGKRPEEVFHKIDEQPIAAASLAQVYKAETMDGKSVAVKVQYIDLKDRFYSDMKTLNYLLKIITIMHPKFNLHWVVDELFETLSQELDFEIEGKNSERCARDLKQHDYVHIPKVYWDLSTKRILTTEWIDGIKINNVKELKNKGLNIYDIDRKLITLMAEQIFHTGFVHGDPHPGNIFVRKGQDNKVQIVLLDHGLYEYLPEKTRISLCNFWESMILKNTHALNVYGKELNVEDPILLAEILTQAPYSLSSFLTTEKGKILKAHMIKQAQEHFDRITATLRTMPKTMMLIIRNLNTIRAILQDHGSMVDRYRIMAQIAVRGKYKVTNLSFSKYIKGTMYKAKFETYLWLYSFAQWLLKTYLNFLCLMGYDTKQIVELVAAQYSQ
ncbi:putative aarF domain-containing protein kinase 5 isoform X1 [Vespula maculifrons]|uniref:ABC1 atypical kinase-like domain-containing protein n=2 Tax=Vespula TaxID=7451 RepID=A0A834KDH4_VESVU|nr:uncharacterized aarF domain-containing protein kinase 5 isoform X1 [Vespula vulgaris]KAF7404677.1 hypothetical protein HZH66_003583 [Vespula vulgaris]